MATQEIHVETSRGTFAGIDFGGSGTVVLLTHEVGLNVETWRVCAERLAERAHPIAIDMRGHGRTTAEVTSLEQPWADLGAVSAALGLDRPVLVGEGVGGWHVAAAVIADLLDAAGLAMIGSGALFVGPRDKTEDLLQAVSGEDMLDVLAERFGVGWEGDDAAKEAFLEAADGLQDRDWFVADATPGSWRRVMARCLSAGPLHWRSRPSRQAVRVLTRVDAHPEPFPCSESFARVSTPILFVDGADSLALADQAAVAELVQAGPRRQAITVPGAGLATLVEPEALADALGLFLDEVHRDRRVR